MAKNDDFTSAGQAQRIASGAASSAKDAVDAATGRLDDLRERATPGIQRRVDRAREWAGDTAGRVQARVQAVGEQAGDATDRVVAYARDEPVKALLIGAAVGLALIGLLALVARSKD